jgi:enterochelin esterase family protein
MEMPLFPAINTLAMASCYSPNPKSPLGFDLPFDERTGELREDVWRRWLAWDPVHIIDRYARNLRKLSLLYLDCGTRDEFRHVVEEFDDGHMNIPYRYDRSLELASKAFRTATRGR